MALSVSMSHVYVILKHFVFLYSFLFGFRVEVGSVKSAICATRISHFRSLIAFIHLMCVVVLCCCFLVFLCKHVRSGSNPEMILWCLPMND